MEMKEQSTLVRMGGHPTVRILLFLFFSWTHPSVIVTAADTLKVMTLNFACRDILFVSVCDNCQTRFDLMARAFAGEAGFEGLPDLDTVDVIIAQELGTELENFEQVTNALAGRGFLYSTGNPLPTAENPICSDPPTCFGGSVKDIVGGIGGYESGGLVTFSKYPILEEYSQNWCAHAFPLPAGYLITLLDVGNGRVAVVENHHAYPEYDLGIDELAVDIRTYQFGELAAISNQLKEAFTEAGIPFVIAIGGDTNEDIYSLQSTVSGPQCDLITSDLVQAKFSMLGLDVQAACDEGKIGVPTWDPTKNDLTARFSGTDIHEALDFLIQHSTSSSSGGMKETVQNTVSVFQSVQPWMGQFCESDLGNALPCNNITDGMANALSDHNIVTAEFNLPQDVSDQSTEMITDIFSNALESWNNLGIADDAACGQKESICLTDADCCGEEYSWTGEKLSCQKFNCEPCDRFWCRLW